MSGRVSICFSFWSYGRKRKGYTFAGTKEFSAIISDVGDHRGAVGTYVGHELVIARRFVCAARIHQCLGGIAHEFCIDGAANLLAIVPFRLFMRRFALLRADPSPKHVARIRFAIC